MKLAFLVDIEIEQIKRFRQLVEDAINSVGGRLIYTKQSPNPIRILCAEENKYPSPHVPLPTERVVKNAEKGTYRWSIGNQRDGMDNDHHFGGGFVHRGRSVATDVRCISQLVQEQHHGCHRSNSGDIGAIASERGVAPCLSGSLARSGAGNPSIDRQNAERISFGVSLFSEMKP